MKRFKIKGEIVESETGEYVKYSDFENLLKASKDTIKKKDVLISDLRSIAIAYGSNTYK